MLGLIKKRTACFLVNLESPLDSLKNYLPTRYLKRFLLTFDIRLFGWAYRQLDSLSAEELSWLQFRKLRKILVHAGKTVPYWSDVFKKSKFFPEKITQPDGISVLPITTRAKLQENSNDQFLSKTVRSSRRIPVTTSGTTGEPLLFYNDTREMARRCGTGVFTAMHHGDFKRNSPLLFVGMGRLSSVKDLGKHIDGPDLESEEFRLRELYPLLRQYRHHILNGTTTYILRFLHFLKKDGFTLPLRGVIYTGESLEAEERKELTEFFGCQVVGVYALKECSAVGIQCHFGGYHLLPWLNYVEIIDDTGKPCTEGELGNIAVTYFENMVMPLIRYETGDRGFIRKEQCLCGRASKIIVFAGRAPVYFELQDGKKLNASLFENLLSGYQHFIKKFQVEYVEPDVFTIYYIPQEGRTLYEKQAAEALGGRIRQLAGLTYNPKVFFRKTNDILPNASGKTPILVRKGA